MTVFYRNSLSYAGNPTNNIASDFIGQICYDTSNNKTYISKGLTSADWVEISLGSTNGDKYTDRGNLSSFDFAIGDLTKDGNWHDIDLSSILPAGAADKLVYIKTELRKSVAGGASLTFKTKGNDDDINTFGLISNAANATIMATGWVKCDSSRIIQYKASNIATWTTMNVAVLGWLELA